MNANWLWLIVPAFMAGALYEYVILDAKDPHWGKDYHDGYNDGYLAGQPNNPMGGSILPILMILVPVAALFALVGFVLRLFSKRRGADNG